MSLGDSEWSSFESNSVFDRIPEYNKIILDLSKGNLNGNFSLNKRKSKLSHSIRDILFDQKNDELSYFALFMDSNNASNYLKFLLDVNNFKLTAKNLINLNERIENIEQKENFESNCIQNHYKNFVQDAISIFEKYISKDAKYSIQLNSELITEIISNF
ncbi:unnamed protein product [Brachionus calyciflorus]|uniref:RGS domain-containing protein n=1 Tax=Brachionus calyciflorus TaxID=104777 RepID=A0A814RDQ4_9BILA|nr:unnamed protein product [Brachionus calyciflorus]